MVLSCPATKVCWNALSGWIGLLALKLKYAPGMEPLICPGEPTGPARIRRWLAKAGTVGLPAATVPRVQVAAAPPVAGAMATVGAGEYPAPAAVREMTLSSQEEFTSAGLLKRDPASSPLIMGVPEVRFPCVVTTAETTMPLPVVDVIVYTAPLVSPIMEQRSPTRYPTPPLVVPLVTRREAVAEAPAPPPPPVKVMAGMTVKPPPRLVIVMV